MFRALTLVTVLTTVTLAAVDGRVRNAAVDPPVPREAARQFNALVADVHDRRIDRDAARERIRALLPSIAADFHARGGVDAPADAWRFPLATYGSESIGGKNGSGYQPAGYDWFDGYMSHGHPAHDIFIRDRGEDELDDATGKAVEVLSISSGTVVALATDWVPGSILRGGRYVYVYDPMRSSLFYYAHLRSLHVELGDIVSPGQAIATVGRSGRNAIANAPPRDVSGHRRRCSTSARHLSRPAPAGAPAGRRLKASLCFASIPPSESSRQGRRRQPNEDASPSSGTSQRSQPFTPGRRDSAVILRSVPFGVINRLRIRRGSAATVQLRWAAAATGANWAVVKVIVNEICGGRRPSRKASQRRPR